MPRYAPIRLRFALIAWAGLIVGGQPADAQNATAILWSNSSSSTWQTTSNWTGSVVPTASQVAQFGTNPSGTSGVGIDFGTTTNAGTQSNGNRIQAVGAVEVTSARASSFLIGNSSTASGATGKLQLNGVTNSVSNVVLHNSSDSNFTIQDTQASGNKTMSVLLVNTTDNKVIVDGLGNIVINSVIAGTGTPLTVQGSGFGHVDFKNAANTFTGNITITGNEARFAADGSFGNSANTVTLDGGRLAAVLGNSFTIASGRSIAVGDGAGTGINAYGGSTLTYNGVIADKTGETGSWAMGGGGTVVLGGASTYTGSTAVQNGTLQLASGNDRLPTGTVVSLGQAGGTNLGTLDLNGFSQTVAGLNSVSGTNATASNNTVTSTTAATLTVNGAGNSSFGDGTSANSGVITGAISLVKSGSGTLTLGGANTYTGTTTVTAGSLALGKSGALSTASNVILQGGTLDVANGTSNGSTSGGTLKIDGAAAIDFNGAGSLTTLSFKDSSAESWTGSLVVYGWTGNFAVGNGTSRLFVGSNANGLNSSQLSLIQFDINSVLYSATILSTGEVVPVPEPFAALGVVAAGLGLTGGLRRATRTTPAVS